MKNIFTSRTLEYVFCNIFKYFIAVIFFIFFGKLSAQNTKSERIKDKFESRQGQDFSVPAPPKIAFPAQYPKGNKVFLQEIRQNLDLKTLKNIPQNLSTKIILKIDAKGNVLNISTFGPDEFFNNEVKSAAQKATANILWNPGKNNTGEKVVDIVTLPFKLLRK